MMTLSYRQSFLFCMTCMIIFMASGPLPAYAESKKQSLSEVKSRLENERAEEKELKKKMAAAEAEMETSRKQLINLSRQLQDNEKTLSRLEVKMKKSQADAASLEEKLKSDYGSIGNLILALERIRRMPTETLIIRPGAPLQTAESAILLKSILPAINARAESIAKNLKDLETLRTTLESDKSKAIETADTLAAQKKDLNVLLNKREKLYKKTKSEYDVQAEAVAKTAAEAKSLEQLMSQIQKKPSTPLPSRRLSKFKLSGGSWVTPVQGKTLVRFGQHDEIGASSEGIKIQGRSGALVTAPVSGVIRYAGPFRNYGNMVIIEHSGGLHSLMAGLSRMDAHVGEKISAGEPVGNLPSTGNKGLPTLYYELRHNGKPVDPSKKFPDLS